ncbi:MAG: excinuclease ABC subunit UvrA [Tannerellaceae bacterium]|jgi:excinuclease ABC subunit A|nr:excinuclease ABC subunit UvrA [Tannerellaceae bacterium]
MKESTEAQSCIVVKGARVNNLKNIDVSIPRDQFVVITGLSGSGKSSLAFDTLYAEGQRRYVESLSSYARQFLGRMSKPECDYITGIPPAVAIEQKVNTRNPRSTVGTSTEIYEYLRLLFARIGKTISPASGEEVRKHQTDDVVDWVFDHLSGTPFAVFARLILPEGRELKEQLEVLMKEGYTRLWINGEACRISEALKDNALLRATDIEIMIDRLDVPDDKTMRGRTADSVETAFFEGRGSCSIRIFGEGELHAREFSNRFEADGIIFREPSDQMFSFNSPMGACPKCEGFGKVIGIDPGLVVPDKRLSVYEGAVVCWRGETMKEWKEQFIRHSAACDFPIHRPYLDLSKQELDVLWNGRGKAKGINHFFRFVEENTYKVQYRVLMARYRGKTTCPACEGMRLKPEAMYVKVGGRDIASLVAMPVTDLHEFFENLSLSEADAAIAGRILTEIRNRINFLMDVGLGYLSLDRPSNSLSGGESQRINLATSLGSSLVGSLYILDEPSIGLHSRDTANLIRVLNQLKELGNTVIVVEHDEDIIRAADYIIDIGPDAGRLGGEVAYQGPVGSLRMNSGSHTVRYLSGEEQIPVPALRRPWNNYIEITHARRHNLKDVCVKFPLNVMTVVTGVSGSGKSTLVRDILYENLKRHILSSGPPVECASFTGDLNLIREIDFINQNSIGRNSRSNPVTYIGAYDDIRRLYSDQPLSRRMGYTPIYFSFNKEGGRCEECKGEGRITVEMQFMADVHLECEQCHGQRFSSDILEVEYRGANIYDLLEMTVDRAIEFFSESRSATDSRIAKRLQPLQDVGLGYVKLGQASSTLSGGENQRVKLASYLGIDRPNPTFFVFDEPTTGLHFHDVKTLLKAFDELIAKGHTVVIIEHNPEVIKCADHVIDLGPEGGQGGGNIVCTGLPEDIAACPDSYTGRFLADKLK